MLQKSRRKFLVLRVRRGVRATGLLTRVSPRILSVTRSATWGHRGPLGLRAPSVGRGKPTVQDTCEYPTSRNFKKRPKGHIGHDNTVVSSLTSSQL